MNQQRKQAAVAAILDEYKKVVIELQQVIKSLDSVTLTTIADPLTTDENCHSIQTVLAHVVHSGYGYAVYIRKHKVLGGERPEKALRQQASEYITDLDYVLQFTNDTFKEIYDDELEEMGNAKKFITGWGQRYDIEQMMEHAIVHILRHRRQIEKFIRIVKNT